MSTIKAPKGTIAIEEAVLNQEGIEWLSESATLLNPGLKNDPNWDPSQFATTGYTPALLDIHETRLAKMDATGVEYMLLSLTSPGPQGEADPVKAQQIAVNANTWLAAEATKNPTRFGALASVSMHDAEEAAQEARRAVKELGIWVDRQ